MGFEKTFLQKPRHINIPIFIPHEGCPNDCIFCNQHSITASSQKNFSKADRNIFPEIDAALATIDKNLDCEVEIAFFGGSFTGIDRRVMIRLLHDAYGYITRGDVKSVRLSTRPDFIDKEILDILKNFGVRHIEIGVQSMSDDVLCASRRGHTAEQTEQACAMIKEEGFSLTGQMMLGLPLSNLEKELFTARRICEMGADSARIYPTVVFRDTPLCEMAKMGDYDPLTNEQGAIRAAKCMKIFEENNVKILRVGLQSGEGLSKEDVFAGADHAAMGEMAAGELYLLKIKELAEEKYSLLDKEKQYDLIIKCAPSEVSKVAGHKKSNITKLEIEAKSKSINLSKIKICAQNNVKVGTAEIEFCETGSEESKIFDKKTSKKRKIKKLHITNGEYFNEYFQKTTGLCGAPFNEAMMSGEFCGSLFSENFCKERAAFHGVSQEEYSEKNSKMIKAFEKLESFDEVYLYFGKDAFCVCNLVTLLAFLESRQYGGKVFWNVTDDEDFSAFSLENAKEISLGEYSKLVESAFFEKNEEDVCANLKNEFPSKEIIEGLKLYFDFLSDNGKLSKIVKQNSALGEKELLMLLLKNSREYGMSDEQGKALIKRIKTKEIV